MSEETNVLVEARPQIFGYQFAKPLRFDRHLNLISGPNGTMKSNLLLKLRGDPSIAYEVDGQVPRVQAISPRRNIESQNVESALQQFATNKKYEETLYNARNIVLSGFEPYPSLASLYTTAYEIRRRKGHDQRAAMAEATSDLNGVAQRILRNYELRTEWDELGGGFPALTIVKDTSISVPLDGLSAGEREALNLALYLHTIKDRYDVILIDEPEVHLNWSLEEDLFDFLKWFAETYEKQLIIVTHSRVVFDAKYAAYCRFLDFDASNQWNWSDTASQEMLDKLAGTSVRLLQVAHSDAVHIYVEDKAHAAALRSILDSLSAPINVVDLGDRGRVEGLYRSLENKGGIGSNYFIVDGDNRPSKIEGENFIQLDKYCIENCLIDAEFAGHVAGKPTDDISKIVVDLIKRRPPPSNKHTNFFRPILEGLGLTQLSPDVIAKFDVSEIFPAFLKKIGVDKETYIRDYTRAVVEREKIADVFGDGIAKMVASLEGADE